ncbi:acyltransferase [Clostridium pasteurianum]|uniref:Acetyltransferase (Isoleucine patch superfamily) n=1 Tax=Clostridium pasteurianum BC1 TaxID=86416 RepID=R4K2B6_CLOPA|nr:acyltransferase [Clostridium pasteurianum]AGK95891.1 acetyltransferase (isoleucine patch superfamily) [Clostridium pasteurianum BC1]
MLKKVINAVIKRSRTKFYSLKHDIGKDCSFQNIKIYSEKHSIKIGHNTVILRYTELCANSNFPVIIGNNTFINQKCIIRPNIIIGSNVDIGPEVLLISDTHEIGDSNKRAGISVFPPIRIEDGCWIGARVTILGNVTIGKGTIIAANSLVNKNCEPNCIYGGVPAKLIKRLDV